jgi:pyruvate dehydrogenase E1 component alpha subunit
MSEEEAIKLGQMRPRPTNIGWSSVRQQLVERFGLSSTEVSKYDNVAKGDATKGYTMMQLCRQFENACNQAYMQGNIRGFMHLDNGQESIPALVADSIKTGDIKHSYYREHTHALASGVSADAIMAELFGKDTGTSHGMGGSMHFADITKNFWGGYAIVGSHLLLAAGVALACQMQKTNGVVMVFFGDGATNGGEFYESLNFAQLWKLPVVFVCENNLYAMGTPIEVHSSVKEIYRKASAFDMKAMRIDGNDLLTVREQVGEAVEYARSGQGPVLVEAMTYRFRGHSAQDTQKYRSKEDVEQHRSQDPVLIFRKELIDAGVSSAADIDALDAVIDEQVESSVRFADESAVPGNEWLTDSGIYAAPLATATVDPDLV